MLLYAHSTVVPAALALLPPRMDSQAARAMLLSIGLQESKFLYRRQIGGPARGFWQFERAGGVRGVLTHESTAPLITSICRLFRYAPTAAVCHVAIEHHDVLACVFARLLLWTVPGRLPKETEPQRGWEQYLEGWRPGKPHRASWEGYFSDAWRIVKGEA